MQVMEGLNAHDHGLCSMHSIVEVQTKLTTYVRSMRNDNLEIRIAGSSCRSQLT